MSRTGYSAIKLNVQVTRTVEAVMLRRIRTEDIPTPIWHTTDTEFLMFHCFDRDTTLSTRDRYSANALPE